LTALGQALPAHGTLQFLSLRRNAAISNQAWCRFYRTVLPHCFALHALYNDHADGLTESSHNQASWLATTTGSTRPAATTAASTRVGEITGTNGSDKSHRNVDDDDSSAVAAAALYLSLNRMGRGALYSHQGCGDGEAWLDAIYNLGSDTSAIFALISQHPMVLLSGLETERLQ
jgi:hypothetical protein